MTVQIKNRKLMGITASLFAGTLIFAACSGGGNDSEPTPEPESSSSESDNGGNSGGNEGENAARDLLPADLKDGGTIIVGTDSTYAPMEFIDEDGTTIIGATIDLGNAIGNVLGLDFEFETAGFDAIIPGVVDSGKYRIGMSSFWVNDERVKVADFVTYMNVGTLWAANSENPDLDPDNACGMRIAVQKATMQADDLEKRSKACEDEGKPAIQIDQFQGQTEATAAVMTGKDQGMSADATAIGFAVSKSGGELTEVGEMYDALPYGIVMSKEDTEFAQALAAAIDILIADGSYEKILEEWGVRAAAIDHSEILPE